MFKSKVISIDLLANKNLWVKCENGSQYVFIEFDPEYKDVLKIFTRMNVESVIDHMSANETMVYDHITHFGYITQHEITSTHQENTIRLMSSKGIIFQTSDKIYRLELVYRSYERGEYDNV